MNNAKEEEAARRNDLCVVLSFAREAWNLYPECRNLRPAGEVTWNGNEKTTTDFSTLLCSYPEVYPRHETMLLAKKDKERRHWWIKNLKQTFDSAWELIMRDLIEDKKKLRAYQKTTKKIKGKRV